MVQRSDPTRRGKGFALDFGVRHLEADPPEVVIIVDADCQLAPGAVDRLAQRCRQSGRAVQALYLMHSPPDAGLKTRMAELAWIVNLPIAFLVPSSSGHAALVMPILAPLSGFAGVDASLSVTAYQSASGFVNYVTPTSAVIMGGLMLTKVSYDRYLRFVAPFLGIVFVVVSIFMAIGAAL